MLKAERNKVFTATYIHGTSNGDYTHPDREDLVPHFLRGNKILSQSDHSGKVSIREMLNSKKGFIALAVLIVLVVGFLLYEWKPAFHDWLLTTFLHVFTQSPFHIKDLQTFASHFIVIATVALFAISVFIWFIRWYEIKCRQQMASVVKSIIESGSEQQRLGHCDTVDGPLAVSPNETNQPSNTDIFKGEGFKKALLKALKTAKQKIDTLLAQSKTEKTIYHLMAGHSRGAEIAAIVAKWLFLLYDKEIKSEKLKLSLFQLDPVFHVYAENELKVTLDDLTGIKDGSELQFLTAEEISLILCDGIALSDDASKPSSASVRLQHVPPDSLDNLLFFSRVGTSDRRLWMTMDHKDNIAEGKACYVPAHHSFSKVHADPSHPLRFNPQQLVVKIIIDAYYEAIESHHPEEPSNFDLVYSQKLIDNLDKTERAWRDQVSEYKRENPIKAWMPWFRLKDHFLDAVEWRCPGTPAQLYNSFIFTGLARAVHQIGVWCGRLEVLPPRPATVRDFFDYHRSAVNGDKERTQLQEFPSPLLLASLKGTDPMPIVRTMNPTK